MTVKHRTRENGSRWFTVKTPHIISKRAQLCEASAIVKRGHEPVEPPHCTSRWNTAGGPPGLLHTRRIAPQVASRGLDRPASVGTPRQSSSLHDPAWRRPPVAARCCSCMQRLAALCAAVPTCWGAVICGTALRSSRVLVEHCTALTKLLLVRRGRPRE